MGEAVSGNRRVRYSQLFMQAVHKLLAKAARDDTMRWDVPEMRSPDRRVADAAVVALAKWRREDFPEVNQSTFIAREKARFRTLQILNEEEGLLAGNLPTWLSAGPAASPDIVTAIELRGVKTNALPA